MERHTKRLEMKTLPFDAHNHVHMGPSPPICAMLYPPPASKTTCRPPEDLMTSDKVGTTALGTSSPSCFLSGMALMSTHPNDFVRVQYLVNNLPKQVQSYANTGKTERDENDVDDDDKAITPLPTKTVACYGVHPWFLHELTAADWAPSSSSSIVNDSVGAASPRWLDDLESYLVADTGSIVGEIGLDGFHFDGKTKELTSPMEKQVQALEWQMKLAHRLQRPVSIHAVQCFGPLMECLSKFRRNLPPKLYFHAFGGKVGTVDQLLALCGRDIGKVYFGFAPIVSESPPCYGPSFQHGVSLLEHWSLMI